MARFDVRTNLHRGSRDRVPYLLELQTDLLASLDTRLVAPLVPAARFGPPASRLNPVLRIGARNFVMDTALAACIPAIQLGERVVSLAERSAELLGALDFLVSGV